VVAAQVNRLVAAGGRVIVSTVHDIGLTPYARAKEAVSAGQMALLTCLTATFNARVRVEILQDGRFIGLVLADDVTQLAVRFPGGVSAALANVTDAACTAALPNCTSLTLVAGATGASHLWADDRHFGPTMHARLGTLADNRARNNPF
jgi:phospholipase/lecithinase/hemolysin